MSKKVPIKTLLRTNDAFLTSSEKIWLYVQANTKKIALVVGLAAAAVIAVLIVRAVHDSRLAKALDAFHLAQELPPGEGQNDAFMAVGRDYPGTPAARQALYALLGIYLAQSDTGEALPLLDELAMNITPAEESLRPLLLATKAGLLEQAGLADEAMVQYKAAIALAGSGQGEPGASSEFLAELYSSLGRVALAAGQAEEARKAYEDIVFLAPSSFRAYTAQVRLAQLSGTVTADGTDAGDGTQAAAPGPATQDNHEGHDHPAD
jgi:tetratricopeptide (TPR) repeat protein